MNRIKLSVITVAFTAVMALSGCGGSDSSTPILPDEQNTTTAKALSLSIFHVNDTHSHLDSESYSFTINGVATTAEIGGYPRVVTKIKELQASKTNTLTLNAGDTFQGTLYYSLFKGKADSDMLNMVSWDALELGNHEFDDGDAALATYLGDLNLKTILAANVEAKAGSVLAGKWAPYFVKEFNGEKVGVVGIDIKQKTEVSSSPSSDITFFNEIETAQKYINELKAKGVNKIVLLTHVGLDNDKQYVSQLSGVDIVIGGDSHSLMGDFSAVGVQANDTAYPFVTTNKDGEKVCIGHAWQYAYAVGAMDVAFSANGVVESCAGDATLLLGNKFIQNKVELNTASPEYSAILNVVNTHSNLAIVAKDSAAETKLASYRDQVDAQKNVVIGEASERLGHARIPGTTDSVNILPLGSDIAPIVAKSFYDLSLRSDACIQNAGGVRISINEGNVTMGTAYTLLPFANTLFEIDMYGNEIKQVLEDALTNYLDNGGSTGSFPYAYGLKYDVNTKAAANNRISNLEIKNRTTGTWSEIQDNTMYVIVTNNYTGGGKDGYVTFKTVQDERGTGVDTYLDYALSFVRYMENLTKEGKKLEKLPADDHCIKSFDKVLTKVGSYNTTLEAGSEIVAYDATTKQAYATNGAKNQIDVISLADVKAPVLVKSIDLSPYGTGVNSVAVKGGKLAVAVEVKTNDLLENFVTFNNWNAASDASNKNWAPASYKGKPYAYINGYGGDVASDDWLISEPIDFNGSQVLSFETATKFTGSILEIKISTDYDGTNLATATWTNLSANLSTGDYVFVNSGDIDLSAYKTTGYIAFHYTSTGTKTGEASAWEVANLRLTNMKADTHDKGKVVIFDANGNYEQNVTVGHLPDMVTFNEDGTKIIVANEGEPNGLYNSDPMGSVGVIELNGTATAYTDINFLYATLKDANDTTPVRLGATPSNHKALDIEPEYITVNGNYAYVTLQENNALAKVNLTTKALELVKSFGAKSWEAGSNNTIDIEEEGNISMKSYPSLFGLYMPDSIASYDVNGTAFLVTANEGDGREYPVENIVDGPKTGKILTDDAKISKLKLDSTIASAYANDNDLKVTIDMGDTDKDGDYDKLYTYGARSFSIWDANGVLVWDSGDAIEKKVAELQPLLFNQDEGKMDGRSGNKGAEPEALAVGVINGKTYAFVGLERQNAILVYNITDPKAPVFEEYYITEEDGDISAEGMKFVPASESSNGKNLLLVAYEVSGSTAVYVINK